MDANEPGLFDLPGRERSAPELPLRARNRETWARTATAEVTITDAGVLHEAVTRIEDDAVTIRLRADPDLENIEPGASRRGPASDAFDTLGWLIWPTDGMEGLLEAGASGSSRWIARSWPSPLIGAQSTGRSRSSSPTSTNCVGSLRRHTRMGQG